MSTTRATSPLRLYTMTITPNVKFITESCPICDLIFAMEENYQRQKLADKTRFYCPNGDWIVYTGKSDEQRLREELEQAQRSLTWAKSREEAQRRERRAAELQARAYKGHVTRLRNRMANGVCPVQGCQRSFQDVRRHIASKHPEWAHEHTEVMAASDE